MGILSIGEIHTCRMGKNMVIMTIAARAYIWFSQQYMVHANVIRQKLWQVDESTLIAFVNMYAVRRIIPRD